MSQINIATRIASSADVGILLQLVGSAYRGDASRTGWTTEADLLVGDRIDEAGMLAKIAEPDGVILLAFEAGSSGALVACCELLKREDASGYFGLFAVDPKHQGGGLGKQMLQIAENYARDILGVKTLEMFVIGLRTELIAYYMRRGYRLTGQNKPFPYDQLVSGARALRHDLTMVSLEKDLLAGKRVDTVV